MEGRQGLAYKCLSAALEPSDKEDNDDKKDENTTTMAEAVGETLSPEAALACAAFSLDQNQNRSNSSASAAATAWKAEVFRLFGVLNETAVVGAEVLGSQDQTLGTCCLDR